MCNDITFISSKGDKLWARGMTEHSLMRLGNLGRVEQLRHNLPVQFRHMTLDALWKVPDSEKISVQFRELANVFGCRLVAEAQLGWIVLPRYRTSHPYPAIRPVPADELAESIRSAYDEPPHFRRQPWHGLFRLDLEQIERDQLWMEREAAKAVPGYSVHRSGDSLQATQLLIRHLQS
jgi:hypothetical protein